MSTLECIDVFTEIKEDDTIVDADVIEAVKENIQPLQKGRRATALSAIFSTPFTQRDAILSRRRAQFRLQVAQAMEDEEEDDEITDALDVYSRFVAWTLESYPQGQSAESGLLELLEEATRRLKDKRNYKQDHRYLKLWILYASYVEKPSTIYEYLLANEVGTKFSQLYESYALVLERDGRRTEADDIYNIGISRNVENIHELKKRHSEFLRRMLVAEPLSTAPSPAVQLGGAPRIGQRSILGETVTKSRSRPQPTVTTSAFAAPQPNARLQIFVDPTGENSENAGRNEWADLGTRVSRVKENRPEVLQMGVGPLAKRRSAGQGSNVPSSNRIMPHRDMSTRLTGFVPFRDEDDTSLLAERHRTTVPATQLETTVPQTPKLTLTPLRDQDISLHNAEGSPPISLRPRNSGGAMSEAEALRKDPFKNYDIRPTSC